jgi:hypothetical protein
MFGQLDDMDAWSESSDIDALPFLASPEEFRETARLREESAADRDPD